MKKTLLVTTDFHPNVGGVAKYNKQISDSFSEQELVVLTSVLGDDSSKVIRSSLLFSLFWPKWLKGVLSIYRVYKRQRCSQLFVSELLPVGNMAYILHRLFNIPYILQIHGMDLLQAKSHPRKKGFAQKIIANAKKVVVNSKEVGEIVSDFSGRDDYTVVYPVPNKYDQSKSKVAHSLQDRYNLENKRIILTVGRLVQRKGFDITLAAMNHVWQTHPETVYVIVGDGPDKERLQTMAKPHGNQVIFTGRVSEEEKLAWFSLCDIFCMPARANDTDIEGFGIVYLEAASFGKPSIAGKIGGAKEAVLHETTGLLVDPNDMDEVAMAIQALLTDEQKRTKLGTQAQQRLQEKLTWKEQLEKLKQALV